MKADEVVLVAAKYRVAAFFKENGRPLWETELITGFFKMSAPFVTLAMDDSGVYAHVSNQLFRLDLTTGKIIWQQEIATLGRDVASLALLGSKVSSTATAFGRINAERKSD